MEHSILTSTKKILSLPADYTAFDQDVLTHINASFSFLYQIGLGPSDGISVQDETSKWEDFFSSGQELNLIKTYVYLKVRLFFDPPATSYLLTAAENQLKEIEWRLNVFREERVHGN